MSSCQSILTQDEKLYRHRGDYSDFVKSHRREVRLAMASVGTPLADLQKGLFRRIHDFRALRFAWEFLEQNCGHAPGDDGETYSDFPRHKESELWSRLRCIGNDVRTNHYAPQKLREIKIAKSSGKGFRTLRLPTIWDRVVQRAALEIIQPLIDPTFDRRSFGWRPERSQSDAVKAVRHLVEKENRRVWVCDDIKDCFEHVPRKRLLNVLKMHLGADDTLGLLSTIIGADQKRGLAQGGPLSPFLVNVYLDHFLDQKWRKTSPDVPLIRSGDDIVILCRNMAEAETARTNLRSLLSAAGMPLKANAVTGIRDLSGGESAVWLGLCARCKSEKLTFEIAYKGWLSFESRLERVAQLEKLEWRARNLVEGWILHAVETGVTVDVKAATEQVINLLYDVGFSRLAASEAISKLWEGDNTLWEHKRHLAWVKSQAIDKQHIGPCTAADLGDDDPPF